MSDWDEHLDKAIARELDARGDLAPPWARFPDYTRTTIGWRMGYGEDWMHMWHRWLRRLPDVAAKRAYLLRHRLAPRTWANLVHMILEPDDFQSQLPDAIVEAMIRDGLVADDVAFDSWVAQETAAGGTIPAPWSARMESPASAARYATRTLGFMARWALVQRSRDPSGSWIAAWGEPPAAWAAFATAAATGEAGRLPELNDGMARIAMELAAAGAPSTPWALGLGVEDYTDSYEQSEMSYTDGWVLWVNSTFDDPPTWRAYLRHRGLISRAWEQLILDETGLAVR